MRRGPAALAIVLSMSMSACVRSAATADELDGRYYLSEDVEEYDAEAFTGFESAWFTGPEKVRTICRASIPVQGATVLPKGSPVKILDVLDVSGVDASHREAKLEIAGSGAGAAHVVYVRWPESRSLLTTESPPIRE